MRRAYTVVVHRAEEGGHWVQVPALPGCYSTGDTIDAALRNVRDAIETYIEALREEGEEVPREPKRPVIGLVKVAV